MKQNILCYAITVLFSCVVYQTNAQTVITPPDLPQRTVVVQATQTLNFGDISVISGSTGGKVIVGYDGSRTSSGSVVLLSMGTSVTEAIFELHLCPGRRVTINYPSTTSLEGNNGGSLTLHIGPTNYGANGSTFTSNKGCDDTHYIRVGGTLDVGSITSNPAGLYAGEFVLTFIQE